LIDTMGTFASVSFHVLINFFVWHSHN
jgi:hypothetical protein